MQNLRDKLLKAGLVSEDQAKKVEESAKSAPLDRPPRDARPRDDRPRDDRPRDRSSVPPRDRRDFRSGPPRSGGRPEPRGGGRPEARGGPPEVRIAIKRDQRFGPVGVGAPRREAPIPKLPPLPGSREHQRQVSKKQVELDRKLRELVASNQVEVEPGEATFYFVTRKQRLRRLDLSTAQHAQLESGVLAVVERPDPGSIEHALVPAAIAEEMLRLSDKAVRFVNKGDTKVGFISEDELKSRQEDEASGEAETHEAAAEQREEAEQADQIAQEQQATSAGEQAASAEVTASGAEQPAAEQAKASEAEQPVSEQASQAEEPAKSTEG